MPKRLADMCTASQFLAPHPLWCAPCTRSMSGRLRRYPLRLRYRRSLLCREFSNSKDRPSPKLETRPERRSEEHTSELQSQFHLVCRLLLEKKKNITQHNLNLSKDSTYDTAAHYSMRD